MRNARILVVDDDSTVRNFLVDALSGEGYKTSCVMSGEDAIHELEQQCCDLAIVDLNLAGWISGLDLLREIRGLCPEMKVIVCSAQTDRATVEEVLTLGAKEFMEKPFEDLNVFLDTVKKALVASKRS